MKIKTLFLALLCLSLPSTTYSEQIYWDCNNDCDISAGLDRNSRNEIFIDNAGSNCLKFIPFTFNNPDSCDFSFKIRLRDGDEIDNASRLLSPSAPSAEFGIVWDYIDSDNYSSAIFKRNTNNHFDEITRKDCFHVAIQVVSNGEKSIVKESDIDSKMAFEPNKYNTFQIKVDNGVLSLSAGNKELSTLFSCEYIPQKTFSAGIVAGKNKISIKRIEFKSIPDKRVSNKTSYTQADVEQAVKNTGNDFYVGFWRYFDRNTDDSRFELGGKYTIALVPTDSGYNILYISGANRFSSYWSPYMKKGALVRTPFYNQYEIHWFTADKNLYFDECYASVSEDILTLHFPIQQSTVRFYRFTPSSENP